MILEPETPGTLAGAAEGEFSTGQVVPLEYRIRKEWATAAWFALDHCELPDVLHICASWLTILETDGPALGDLRPTLTRDALFWADCAPPHELAAFGTAALDRLHGLRLGIKTRKRLFARLWETFDPGDRQAFLARVDAEGRFLRKGAA